MNASSFTAKKVLLILCICVFNIPILADVSLPNIFGHDMVLQRNKPISIWGWADPGEKVTLNGSWQGARELTITTDKGGKWEAKLPSANAGGPYTLTIRGKNTIELTNILIGEVWVCSGQSNMHFSLNRAIGGEETVKNANYPEIRLFKVPVDYSLEPKTDVLSNWQICTPKTAGDFSAVGFFFGLELYKELKVPIGLIKSAVGGTAAELWTPSQALEGEPVLKPILDRWENTDDEIKKFYSHGKNFDFMFDNFRFIPKSSTLKPLLLDDFEDDDLINEMGGRWAITTFDSPVKPEIDLASPGSNGSKKALRYQGLMNVGEFFHLISTFDPDGKSRDLSDYEGISFDILGNGLYRFFYHQPTVNDWDDYSIKKQAGLDWQNVEIKFTDLRQAGWGVQTPFTSDQLYELIVEPAMSNNKWGLPRPPSSLYNGMISPIVPFTIQGAIWHQGSANASRAYQYRTILPTMITGWRDVWGQGDFQFIIVQSQKFQQPRTNPSDNNWAELREAQLMTAMNLPNTGIGINVDIGSAVDIHQRNKKPVAHRLALWALGTTYGKDIVYSGPIYKSSEIIDKEVKIRFNHTGDGLTVEGGSVLKGFEIAGSDRKFYWADARIENNTVIVSSEKVPNPVAVRYGWQANSDCNLYNSANLPASPFRTDDWPGITFNNED